MWPEKNSNLCIELHIQFNLCIAKCLLLIKVECTNCLPQKNRGSELRFVAFWLTLYESEFFKIGIGLKNLILIPSQPNALETISFMLCINIEETISTCILFRSNCFNIRHTVQTAARKHTKICKFQGFGLRYVKY